jgi:hypothetical protein
MFIEIIRPAVGVKLVGVDSCQYYHLLVSIVRKFREHQPPGLHRSSFTVILLSSITKEAEKGLIIYDKYTLIVNYFSLMQY